MPDDRDDAPRIPPISISSRTTRDNRTGSWKYIRPVYRDHVAPCNQACPVGIDIEGYMNLLREGREQEAADLLLRENPMPATTGRVCHHPCETACHRGGFDEPLAIHAVERVLGDRILAQELPAPLPRTRRERVAVVGSGPAGLACAYHLLRAGYGVECFEAADRPGGVLRTGIPDYRLPAEVVDRECDRIRALGATIHCGARLGGNVPWSRLDAFDAVFLAPGAQRSRGLELEGGPDERVMCGLDFLRDVKKGQRTWLGREVVVVGGGNTAMDCARTALRLGSRVTVLYRRGRGEMPAIREEVEEAEKEGVRFRFLAAPVGVQRSGGRLDGLVCEPMRLGDPDESGRRRPVPVPDRRFTIPADTVLSAVGEEIDPSALPGEVPLDRGAVPVNRLGGARAPRWFAGGDAIDQARSVADALGSGKRAALGIDRHLRGLAGEATHHDLGPLRWGRGNLSATRWRGDDPVRRTDTVNECVPFDRINTEHFVPAARHSDRHASPDVMIEGFAEANRGLTHAAALSEAARCFNCGVCNGCELCLIYCPDIAISRREGGGFRIAYEYCKGCGVCAHECPRGAMAMTREGL